MADPIGLQNASSDQISLPDGTQLIFLSGIIEDSNPQFFGGTTPVNILFLQNGQENRITAVAGASPVSFSGGGLIAIDSVSTGVAFNTAGAPFVQVSLSMNIQNSQLFRVRIDATVIIRP